MNGTNVKNLVIAKSGFRGIPHQVLYPFE